MYRHIKSYELRYTDVDAYDNIKLSSLLAFLEESACLSADELGFGYSVLVPHRIGFIIANWYVELNRSLKLGEIVTVHTWPLKPKHLIFLRDFEIYVGEEKVGVATARWCMINLDTYAMLPVNSFFPSDFFDNYNTERSVIFSNWKIPPVSDGVQTFTKRASYSDYDHNFHVNNTKYADYLMDVFTVEELKNKSVRNFQITYVKQCKEGDELKFVREFKDGYYLVEGSVDGDLRVQFKIKFNED